MANLLTEHYGADLESCIRVIRNMPDILMEERHGIILDFKKSTDLDAELIRAIRKEYRNRADWLEYYLLDRVDLLPELTFTSKVNYKSFAELSIALLKIIQEVNLRSEWARSKKLTPRLWWVLCEADLCDTSFKNSGLTGKAQLMGKGVLYENALRWVAQMSDVGKLKTISDQGTALEGLEGEAVLIARHDLEFRNTYYNDFLKAIKRHYRKLRDSPLVVTYIDDGTGKTLDRGRDTRGKLPPKKTRKGFS